LTEKRQWKVSLHGGHSGQYCEHARDTLRQVLEKAVETGYTIFGVSEHAPRTEERFLYKTEIEKGYDVDRLRTDFAAYASAIRELVQEFEGRLTVLRGFEAEVVPDRQYVELMQSYRQEYGFDYMVGSVHHVKEIQIDGEKEAFESALKRASDLETLAIRYYEKVKEMVAQLQPEVVAHFDLIRKNAEGPVDTSRIREFGIAALQEVARQGAILDVNTAGYRKGLGTPYPAPWVLEEAGALGIGFCFGDDSHGVDDVGAGLDAARQYLMDHGVDHITVLDRQDGRIVRREVPL